MVPVARRNLLAEKARFLMAVGGVTAAVFLILIVIALYQGFKESAGAFIRDLPAEVWVFQAGTRDLYHSGSLLPEGLEDDIQAVTGVQGVYKLLARNLRVEVGGEDREGLFLAFPSEASPLLQGMGVAALPGRGQVIANEAVASAGDSFTLGGRRFEVVASYETVGAFGFYSFLNYDDAQELFSAPGFVSYFLVLADPSQAAAIAEGIDSQFPEVDALTRHQFADRSGREADTFLPVISVLVGIGFAVGAAVISITIYTATIEKARDFGVLKAIGASNGFLYRLVITQSFVVGLVGLLLGIPLAILAGRVIERIVPEFVTLFPWEAALGVFAAVIFMSLLAAILPIRRIARVEPAMVFRA